MVFYRFNWIHFLLFIAIINFTLLGLWIRLLPMNYIFGMYQPIVLFEDPWYTIRQVEQILLNFPNYSWYDPMLAYPTGKVVDWGPIFPLFITLLVLIFGATTHEQMILVSNWAPVILGLLLIPLTFLITRCIWDSRAGWLSAILICVAGGETIFRSSYGYVDHHVMEIVLTVGFFLCYFFLFTFYCS